MGLKNREEWKSYYKSGQKPDDIPANPDRSYKDQGWNGYGDWLGTGTIASQDRVYKPFEDARDYARSLGLKNLEEWKSYCKSGQKPDDIPVAPHQSYKDQGWIGMGDWLGTGTVAPQDRVFRPFEDARDYARSLRLKSQGEWSPYCKSGQKPDDIPGDPSKSYKDRGWTSWSDFLGYQGHWNSRSYLGFLKSIQSLAPYLDASELYLIQMQSGLAKAASLGTSKASKLIKRLEEIIDSNKSDEEKQAILDEIIKDTEDAIENGEITDEELDDFDDFDDYQVVDTVADDEANGPRATGIAALTANHPIKPLKSRDFSTPDNLVGNIPAMADGEAIGFMIANRTQRLWNAFLNNGEDINAPDIQEVLSYSDKGEYYQVIVNKFLTQLEQAKNIPIPDGYKFRLKGQTEITLPNMMQRLTTVLVQNQSYVLNMSGTGAGKTLSAVFTSRVIDARVTVIVAMNATLSGWESVIKNTFPDSVVFTKDLDTVDFDRDKHNYVILNFESFQQPNSSNYVRKLLESASIDFLVIDEIHNIKQRSEDESKRLQILRALRVQAQENNPELKVLGMSATPVINNLMEGKKLLEFVTGHEYKDLMHKSNVNNALRLHYHLVINGIRYRPSYMDQPREHHPEIDASDHIDNLLKVPKGDVVAMERALLKIKMPTLLANIKKGTIVYSHYVGGGELTQMIADEIRAKLKLKVGIFTGEDNTGVDLFRDGKVDVLVGSKPVSTGVDGLQHVSNRMVISSLPWTAAEYHQLIGRIHRQGSKFTDEGVDIVIPVVYVEGFVEGGIKPLRWSYDESRLGRIHYKRTLADCAVDGTVAKGELADPSKMLKKSQEALDKWVERLENDEIMLIDRSMLIIPLPPEVEIEAKRRHGDFSEMNRRWNITNSQKTHKRLQDDPSEWYLYHTLYGDKRKNWEEIPYEKIAEKINQMSQRLVVADLGCGEALLAKALPNHRVHSFDHIAINEDVVSCDISKIPLMNGDIDVAVFSLSLMGCNLGEYLTEAHRCLANGGTLMIAEPKDRWSDCVSELIQEIESAGFVIEEQEIRYQFLYVTARKPL